MRRIGPWWLCFAILFSACATGNHTRRDRLEAGEKDLDAALKVTAVVLAAGIVVAAFWVPVWCDSVEDNAPGSN